MGVQLEEAEDRIVQLLKEVLDLDASMEQRGVSVVPSKKVLDKLSAKRGDQFWKFVGFWESYLQTQIRAQHFKNVVDNVFRKFIENVPQEKRLEIEGFIQKLLE